MGGSLQDALRKASGGRLDTERYRNFPVLCTLKLRAFSGLAYPHLLEAENLADRFPMHLFEIPEFCQPMRALTVELVAPTAAELGFTEHGPRTYDEFNNRALSEGFTLCPYAVAAELLLARTEVPKGQCYDLAMRPFRGRGGDLIGLALGCDDRGPWIDWTYRGPASVCLSPEWRFILVNQSKEQGA